MSLSAKEPCKFLKACSSADLLYIVIREITMKGLGILVEKEVPRQYWITEFPDFPYLSMGNIIMAE